VVDTDIPLDVIIWLRDFHNLFHDDGASITFIQMLDEVLNVDAAWQVHKDLKGIVCRIGRGQDSWCKASCR
jgi:hypothetical protein